MKKIPTLFLLLTLAHFLQAQRNVILIIADDLGTDYLGFYEDHQDTVAMPNIRKLLSKGVRFTNAMSNPVCSATRAGMLTGRYSFRTGVGGIVGGIGGSGVLDINEITIPRLLNIYKPNKFGKANIGKWHLHQAMPTSNLNNPNIMGYDYFAGNFIGQLTSYYNWTKVTNGVSSTVTTYATTETANDAINWINTQNPNPQTKKPFFLWLAFNAPHAPYHLPPAGLHSYTNLSGTQQDIMANPKPYFKASLEALDHEIGRIFDDLQTKNLLDSTDIIFIGDNGNTIQTAQIANTARAKGTIYQYGIHVPFIISGPSVVAPGRVSDALVNTTDLFATILELFGYNDWKTQIPANKPVDSKSILPILKNTGNEVRPWAFTEIFKVTTDGDDGKTMRNHDFKLLHFDDGHEEFYQLATDPGETNNLMLGALNATQTTNYLYLCNEMSTLVGTGSFCNPAIFPPLSALVSTTNVDCFGNATGAINLTVSGGKLPYSFNWGGGVAAQNRSGLVAGTYTVTITDAAAQTLIQTVTITQPNAALSAVASSVSVACFGDQTGTIQLNVSGGQGAYTFLWNDGNVEQNRSGLTAGVYTATVTDANNCISSISQTIEQPSAALSATASGVSVACLGDATGAIQLNVSGGKGAYSFLWNDGNVEQNRSGLTAGVYTATVTDANNCFSSIYQTITQPDASLSVADSAVNVTCFGATSGAIHLLANGGTPAYTYAWNDGNSDQNRTDLPAGTYSVTVTDANQCTVSSSKTISQPTAINTAISASDATCGKQNGAIHADISGGTAPYTILWSDGSIGIDLINIPSRNYGFTITDANGCTFTDHVIISNLDGPSTQLSASPVTCNGGADGSINLIITGGTAPFSYHWNDGTTSADRSNLIAGTYVVTVTDANGCSSLVARTITEPAPLYGYITSSPEACGYLNGALSLSINGGTAPYQYHWSNNKSSAQISDLSAGDYTVTVTDAHGCTVAYGGSVGELNGPSVAVTTTAVSCAYAIDGSYTLDISGGKPPYSLPAHYTQTGQYPGMYTQDVYDANGCYTTVNFSIYAPEPVYAMVTTIPIDCYGNTSGGAEITAGGGTPPYTYEWNNGQNTQNLTNVPAGHYSVIVKDAHECYVDAYVHLIEPAPLFLTFSATATNGANIGTISAMAIGGTLPYTYLWSNGATEADLSHLAPGPYTVTVTDAHNCTITGSAVVDLLIGTMNIQDTTEPSMFLHPNPASDKLFVDFSIPDMQVNQLRITNALGNTLLQIQQPNLSAGIDLSAFPAGIYFLQITSDQMEQVAVKQFIKIR
ncbi:MAG: sulfatase-like hydrolase/transferase [Bacteroidota bacterium]